MKTPLVHLLLALWATFPLVSLAVDVYNYHDRDCTGNFARCTNIKPCRCCTLYFQPEVPPGEEPPPNPDTSWTSTQCRGIDLLDQCVISTQYGKKYKIENGNYDPHQPVCLNLQNARTSAWFRNTRPRCRPDHICPWDSTEGNGLPPPHDQDSLDSGDCALCDVVSIDNRLFPINHGVSPNVTQTLVKIFTTGGTYEHIPQEIRLLEIKDGKAPRQ